MTEISQLLPIVFPAHPRTHKAIADGGFKLSANVRYIDPVGYLDILQLEKRARAILTDSGGIQEEMPSLHRPVLVMREKTERPEGIRAGVCRLVGTQPDTIKKTVLQLLDNKAAYRKFGSRRNPFGDGKAATRIVRCLRKFSRVPSP